MKVFLWSADFLIFFYVTSHEVNISFYHIFVRKTYLSACVINEEVPDPYQSPVQIPGYLALRQYILNSPRIVYYRLTLTNAILKPGIYNSYQRWKFSSDQQISSSSFFFNKYSKFQMDTFDSFWEIDSDKKLNLKCNWPRSWRRSDDNSSTFFLRKVELKKENTYTVALHLHFLWFVYPELSALVLT
jgi:hypothetical protein